MNEEFPPQSGTNRFLIALAITAVLAIAFSMMINSRRSRLPSKQLNRPFPEIQALTWLNGPAVTMKERRNHVVVVDAWASWCEPCRDTTPALKRILEKYKDKGVIVLGMTSDGLDVETRKN